MGSIRRTCELADIAPQYVAKSGLCNVSEVGSNKWGSIRIQHVTGLTNVPEGKSRFPKLDECAHFHYEHVEIGPLQVSIADDENLKPLSNESEEEKWWSLSIESQGKIWLIRRSYDNFRMLDQQLHRCIYDRKFSELTELPAECIEDKENIHKLLSDYVKRFSDIAGNLINCGPILNWLELDNRGHRLLVADNDNCPINTPAVAAAYSVKRYIAQAPDEISFEVGDMISVIDMPPPEESIWWHGKKGFQVGFFPCECVAVIGDKVPRNLQFSSLSSQPTKPVLRKHGKLIAFFRSFILSRPSRRRLKQSGILRERVFGCDLGEHLLNSGHEIPMVLKCCVEFIETHGVVDGIYRLSGVTSNIQKLRNAFDEDRVPALYEDEAILQDVHSVASLLKMYFRELPNPLCTYQLYHQFVGAVQATQGDDTRLLKMRDVVQKLPPPHYRTLEYLMRHLARVSEKGHETGMTSRNVAIVWAPNLLRCKELEVGGVAALQGVGVQAVVTEFLICYAELIFCDRLPNFSLPAQQVSTKKCRPKSLAISTPTKLLSLEEARNRALLQASGKAEQGYIEVGGGPANLPAKYHTVIELPGYSRKRMGSKRSPLGWKSLFGKSGRSSQRKEADNKGSTPADIAVIPGKAITEADLAQSRRHLRPAKSAESLSSGLDSDTLDVREPINKVLGTIENTLSPTLLRLGEGKSNGHNRSVSHESYFDHLGEQKDNLDISEIEVNFELEESEMRIFSEDETIMSTGSGSLASNGSPRILSSQKHGKGSSVKRLSYPKLTGAEDRYDNTQNADPSPKKQKTNDEDPPRSKLEEQLSSSAGDIQFIDSVSPDQGLGQGDVHPIQSPSPVSSISQISSSLLAPSSPILPHIPHLMKSFSERAESRKMRSSTGEDEMRTFSEKSVISSDFAFQEMKSSRPHSTVLAEINSYSYLMSPTQRDEPAPSVSDKESLQSSELTTPETPICSTYTPLVDFEDSSLSNMTTPDADLEERIKKSSSDNLDTTIINSCLEVDNCEKIGEEVAEFEEKISSGGDVQSDSPISRPHREIVTADMIKLDELKAETVKIPKPEERKPKPVHPYVNIPFFKQEIEVGNLLETSFDGEPITYNRNSNFTVKYEKMSTESSDDFSLDVAQNEENNLPLNEESDDDDVSVLKIEFSSGEIDLENSVPLQYKTGEKNDKDESSMNSFVDQRIEGLFSSVNVLPDVVKEETESSWASTRNCNEEKIAEKEGNSEKSVNTNSEVEESEEEKDSENFVTDVNCDVATTRVTDEDEYFGSFGEKKGPEVKEKESMIEKDETIQKAGVWEFANPEISSRPKEIEGLLETDLDAPEKNFEALANQIVKVEEMAVASDAFLTGKSSSNAEPRQLLMKYESDAVGEMADSSEVETTELGKREEDESRSIGSHLRNRQRMVKEKTEERPKTLERLSTRRKTETDSVELAETEVQVLGKSKSGSYINEKSPDIEKVDILSGCEFDLSDPQRRERIEKYKEKRRNYLREKYRSDSFKTDKDDFVLKIKQRHLRKSDWGDVRDREAERVPEPVERRSPEKKEKPGPRLWKALDPTVKEPGRRTYSAEIPDRIRHDLPAVSTSLRNDPNQKKIFNGGGERRSLSHLKSARGSPEKKNHFLNFSLGGSIREEGPSQVSPTRKTSPRLAEPPLSSGSLVMAAGVTEKTDETDIVKQRTGESRREGTKAPIMCIKDMAAMFEGRNDSKPAKQYLSSV